jgi:hypothetical protein
MAEGFFSGAAAAVVAQEAPAAGLGPGVGGAMDAGPADEADAGVIAGSIGMPRPGVAPPIGLAGTPA